MAVAHLSLPRLQQLSSITDDSGQPSSSFHIWWDNFASSIEGSFNNLADQVSDDVLTPEKKSIWITLYNTITTEQSGIDAQATLYSITTEKTAYDNSISTLTTYLSTLTSPVAWNDVSGSTNITGVTFRADFENVLTAKSTLLTKIDAVSGTKSNWSGVNNDNGNKPQDNATYGADLAVNVTNANTSHLTDGAGLGDTSIIINPPNLINIAADSTGVIKTGELPATTPVSASRGNTAVTTLGTWARTNVSGVTCSIGASTGILTITAITVTETFIPVTFTYNGVSRGASIHVVVNNDPPTSAGSSGSGGSSASTTTLGNTTGTIYDTANAVSAVIYCAAGSGGQVALAAPVAYKSVDGVSTVTATGKWQWDNAGTWTDVSTDVTGSSNDFVDISDGGGNVKETPGGLGVYQTKTGLTSGTTYGFRLLWKDAGARIRYTTGTLTATGS